jgi:TAP C-terminal domain
LEADSQRVAMLQLQALTGLNFQWTMMCLEANGWDLALAKSNYDELISSVPVSNLLFVMTVCTYTPSQPMIPPEAYIQT